MSPKFKRVLITSLVILLGAVITLVAFQGSGWRQQSATGNQQTQPTNQPGENATAPPEPAAGSVPAPEEITQAETGQAETGQAETRQPQNGEAAAPDRAAQPDEGADQAAIAAPPPGLHFRAQPAEAPEPLGDLDSPGNASRLRIDFSPYGAGIEQITLADYYHDRDHRTDDHYTLFDGLWKWRPVLGLRRVYINDVLVEAYEELSDQQPSSFHQVAPGSFEALIVDENDQPVLTITRRYELGDVEGEINLRQQVRNETSEPLEVRLVQWGPADLPYSHDGYGDFRRVRFGYLDPRSANAVLASDFLLRRKDAVSNAIKSGDQTVWPNKTSLESKYTLAWVAMTNRYFGFAVHRAVDDPQANTARALDQVQQVEVWLESHGEASLAEIPKEQYDSRFMSLKLVGTKTLVAPGQPRRLDLGIYAGPLRSSLLSSAPTYKAFNLSALVVYQLTCAMCTFQWLTHFLLWFLRLIEGGVLPLGIGVHDWAVSIIILVIFVRLLLHPLTRKGQISLQRTTRGMAKLQPEIKKLQEKYKDNPKKLQQEQMALYREHNVNLAGCLGMLPTMLQSPIWVALYAMLYFAIELRQAPAFYGVFQLLGNWSFLADLSQPDHFINLGHSILGSIPGAGQWLEKIPLIGGVTSINLLPILMGVIFFLQQKYMTPPNPNATPEQESQQKIMKVIFPLVFPLMLYSAPSGLTLYIMTSSTIGILESRYIRAHIDSLDFDRDTKASTTARPAKKVQNRAGSPRRKR